MNIDSETLANQQRELKRQLREAMPDKKAFTWRELDILFEIEAALHCLEILVPDREARDASKAWVLLSGYGIPGINDTPEKLRMCLLLRQQVHYIKTKSAWNYWLNWYRNNAKVIALYAFEPKDILEGGLRFHQLTYSAILRAERLALYELLFSIVVTKTEASKQPWAEAGKYCFNVKGASMQVTFSESASGFAHTISQTQPFRERHNREPIHIDLNALHAAAYKLDQQEAELSIEPRGNWEERLKQLKLMIFGEGEALITSQSLTLDGLFHLVGALGVGKSTLIGIITYYLALERGYHITLMFNTVVESIRFASWLRRLGIMAAPILGRNRVNHEQKYGLANSQSFGMRELLNSNVALDPTLDWMPAPCAISGSQLDPFSLDNAPCYRLEDTNGDRHKCPLIPVCPVHQIERDLVQSQVWIVNPMSFLYSRASENIGDGNTRWFEAIYNLSDVLIIDEADRVQAQWDQAFAPTRSIAGSDHALLDRLHLALSSASVGDRGRRRAGEAMFNRLTNTDDQTHTLSNRVFRLLTRSPKLSKWIRQRQITNVGLFDRLARELAKAAYPYPKKDADSREALQERLQAAFQNYWGNPLRRESGPLASWINNALTANPDGQRQLQQQLKLWLKEMGWRSSKEREALLITKLDFSLTLTAMLKRTQDIFYQLRWIEDEFDTQWNKSFEYDLPELLTALIPEPPLGEPLGVRLSERQGEFGQINEFKALRYQGVGRWLLLHFSNLYTDSLGQQGPHVLITSATSWLPGAAQFHIAAPPDAVLVSESPGESKITIEYSPVPNRRSNPICVSGTGSKREAHLREIIRKLAKSSKRSPSTFQRELDHWKKTATPRGLLLVVGSYEQAQWVESEFDRLPEWEGRVARLTRDDEATESEGTIRAREVERLRERSADILIAPLMAIQRGFNILDEMEGALLGTAYFLVRPYPPPDDLSSQIMSLNAWWLRHLQADGRHLVIKSEVTGLDALTDLRGGANAFWHKQLRSMSGGLLGMDDKVYQEFLRNQFIVIWQTIGRLLRGGRDAHIVFVDGKFGQAGSRQMLQDWASLLRDLLYAPTTQEQQLAQALYKSAWLAFHNADLRKVLEA